MFRLRHIAAALLVLSFVAAPTFAAGQKTHVKGYTKKDGTKVKAHDRKAPEGKTAKAAKKDAARTAKQDKKAAKAAAAVQARDEKGRIQRSEQMRHAFARQTGYPHGRPGYVIDHIRPLACGGPDDVSNMQWQTVAEAKAKDKWERAGCPR